jgi:hypothetical protein
MVQGSDNGKHETHNAVSMAQRESVSNARSSLTIIRSLESCL